MLKKSITYTDYDGRTRTEDYYFNLSRAELTDIEMTTPGGFKALVDRLTREENSVEIYKIFKRIVLMSYGERVDGRHFKKSKKLAKKFMQTEAYSELITELFSDPDKVVAFINGITPPVPTDRPNSNIPQA